MSGSTTGATPGTVDEVGGVVEVEVVDEDVVEVVVVVEVVEVEVVDEDVVVDDDGAVVAAVEVGGQLVAA